MRFVQVRCPTPTAQGICNRWQFEVSSTMSGPVRFKCKHCRETTVVWTSQMSVPVGLR